MNKHPISMSVEAQLGHKLSQWEALRTEHNTTKGIICKSIGETKHSQMRFLDKHLILARTVDGPKTKRTSLSKVSILVK